RSLALSPEQSTRMLELGDSHCQLRLIAAEPLVQDPVEVAFDGSGRMWVVEMRDYPFVLEEPPRGRIKILEDADADGSYDRSILFADQLDMPTGLALWQDGAVVTLAGEVVFLRDQNRDGVADASEQWLTGFTQDNEQLRANHPRLGPDGWWYIACGLRGGQIELGEHFRERFPKREPLTVGSRDIRFHAASGRLETVTGPAQFGLAFDNFGSRFLCSNRNPAVQVVFEQPELLANPLVGLVASTRDIIPAGTDSHVYPLVDSWTTSNLHSGQFTAACGIFLRASKLGSSDSLLQEIFVCEPTGSLVKRVAAARGAAKLVLQPDPRIPDESEWLASRDPWFRPVNVTLSPSDDVIVVDMHRAVIEHPHWVPEELKDRPDQRWGDQTGRIYLISDGARDEMARLTRELQKSPLESRDSPQLVSLLASPNSWLRSTASRILLERGDSVDVSSIVQIVESVEAPLAARIQAFQTAVAVSGAVPVTNLLSTAGMPDALCVGVLRAARSLPSADRSQLDLQLMTLLQNPSDAVVFEALLCMGQSPRASLPESTWERIVHDPHPDLLIAAASAMKQHPDRMLRSWITALEKHPPEFDSQMANWLAPAASTLSRKAFETPIKMQLLASWLLQSSSEPHGHAAKLALLAATDAMLEHPDMASLRDGFNPDFWESLRQLGQDVSQVPETRRAAIAMLRHSPRRLDRLYVADAALTCNDPDVYGAWVRTWAQLEDEDCDLYLMSLLESGTPGQRDLAVELLGQSVSLLAKSADMVSARPDVARSLGPSLLQQLRDRARGDSLSAFDRAIASLVDDDRKQVIDDYRSCLNLEGDVGNGKLLFQKHCASCHRIGAIGIDVGPDISDSRTKSPEQLLISILDPNRVIDNNYFRFVILTESDDVIEGIVAEETQEAIVIRGQENKRTVLSREDIREIKATGVSLMPEGLETQLDPQSMADLIAFIKGWRYEDRPIPTANAGEN
ncbi:MAG: c-type cytochrome, partial [bacterium]|nr:c-type cytochrome [bacterium]